MSQRRGSLKRYLNPELGFTRTYPSRNNPNLDTYRDQRIYYKDKPPFGPTSAILDDDNNQEDQGPTNLTAEELNAFYIEF